MLSRFRTRNVQARSNYMDRVDVDTRHNTVFYIYSLGRYHNRLYLHYGETNDLQAKELKLRQTLPYYTKLVCLPIEEAPHGKVHLDKLVHRHNLNVKLPVDDTEFECMVLPEESSEMFLANVMSQVYKKILIKD